MKRPTTAEHDVQVVPGTVRDDRQERCWTAMLGPIHTRARNIVPSSKPSHLASQRKHHRRSWFPLVILLGLILTTPSIGAHPIPSVPVPPVQLPGPVDDVARVLLAQTDKIAEHFGSPTLRNSELGEELVAKFSKVDQSRHPPTQAGRKAPVRSENQAGNPVGHPGGLPPLPPIRPPPSRADLDAIAAAAATSKVRPLNPHEKARLDALLGDMKLRGIPLATRDRTKQEDIFRNLLIYRSYQERVLHPQQLPLDTRITDPDVASAAVREFNNSPNGNGKRLGMGGQLAIDAAFFLPFMVDPAMFGLGGSHASASSG